jgi:hypothetical protein
MRTAAVSRIALIAVVALTLPVLASAPADASATFTRTQALAFARAVNLRASDLPGSEVLTPNTSEGAGHSGSHEGAQVEEPFACGAGSRPLHPAGGARSLLLGAHAIVASLVEVSRTQAFAERAIEALNSRRGRSCLVRSLGRVGSVEGERTVTSHAVRARFIDVSRLLGAGALAIHVTAELPALEEAQPGLERVSKHRLAKPHPTFLRVDLAVFRCGPALIGFLTFGVDEFPSGTEGRLLSVMHRRALAHEL